MTPYSVKTQEKHGLSFATIVGPTPVHGIWTGAVDYEEVAEWCFRLNAAYAAGAAKWRDLAENLNRIAICAPCYCKDFQTHGLGGTCARCEHIARFCALRDAESAASIHLSKSQEGKP